jgi:hypothetical protein
MNYSKLKVIVSFLFVLLFTGCARYEPKPFLVPKPSKFSKETIPTIKNNSVDLRAKKLSEVDCKFYFSRRILSKGYQPIQLYVKNNSSRTYVLNSENFNMPLEYSYSVARSLHLKDMERFVAWAIPGLLFWPLFIPGLVELVLVSDANESLDNDFEHRILGAGDSIIVRPYSCYNRVMFVRSENYLPLLQVKLIDQDSREILNYSFSL